MAGLARELKDWSRKQRETNADASIGIMDDEMYDLCFAAKKLVYGRWLCYRLLHVICCLAVQRTP
jgi:hypothetical protein